MSTVLDPPEPDVSAASDGPGSATPSISVDPESARGERSAPRAPRSRRGRRPRELAREDFLLIAGCAASGATLSWLVFNVLLDGGQWFGYLFVGYVFFLVSYGAVTADRLGWLVASDRVFAVAVVSAGAALFAPLALLIGYIVAKGLPSLRLNFVTDDLAGVTPQMPADAGGGAHAIVGTIEQVGLALIMSLPLGVGAAIFLNESTSRWRRPVRIFVDAMSGLPSVVAGLFIFATLILPFAGEENSFFGYNGFMASLALSMTMLPTICRTVEVVLRLVPDGLREASLALGSSRARTTWSVVLPTARTGIATAVVLGMARAVGETAPLLFTSFGYDLMNANPFSGPQESLPLFVYRNIRNPSETAIQRGFVGAFVLLLVVLVLFAIARTIGRDTSRRASRRLGIRARLRRSRASSRGSSLDSSPGASGRLDPTESTS